MVDIYHAVRSPGYLKLLLIAALIGIPIAMCALGFVLLTNLGEDFLWHTVPEWMDADIPPWWYVLLIPTVAGVLVAAARQLPGHGGHHALDAQGPAKIPFAHLPSILLAAFLSLAAGVVLGPEAPLIALGVGLAGAIGAVVAKGNEQGIMLLSLCGAFGAIAAIFGNPLAAAVLLIEAMGIGGAMLITAILPALLSAGVGYLVFTGMGSWTGIAPHSLTLTELPPGGRPTWIDLCWAVVVGIACAVLMVLIRKCSTWIMKFGPRRKLSMYLTIPLVGLLVGLSAASYHWITGQDPRDILFSGETQVSPLVADASTIAISTLVALIVLKGFAYGISLGSGFRGGPIFPALFLGAAVGLLAARLLPGMSLLAGFAAGMGAATAAQMRLPLSALVIVTLLFGSAGLDVMPIVIIAIVIGVVVRGLLDAEPPPSLQESDGPPGTDDSSSASPDQAAPAASPSPA